MLLLEVVNPRHDPAVRLLLRSGLLLLLRRLVPLLDQREGPVDGGEVGELITSRLLQGVRRNPDAADLADVQEEDEGVVAVDVGPAVPVAADEGVDVVLVGEQLLPDLLGQGRGRSSGRV